MLKISEILRSKIMGFNVRNLRSKRSKWRNVTLDDIHLNVWISTGSLVQVLTVKATPLPAKRQRPLS